MKGVPSIPPGQQAQPRLHDPLGVRSVTKQGDCTSWIRRFSGQLNEADSSHLKAGRPSSCGCLQHWRTTPVSAQDWLT